MTTSKTSRNGTAVQRNLKVAEWFADAKTALTTPESAARDTPERSFRRVHADPRYRARLYI